MTRRGIASLRFRVLVPTVLLAFALIVVSLVSIFIMNAQTEQHLEAHRIANGQVPLIDEMITVSERAQGDVYQLAVLRTMQFPLDEVIQLQARLERDLTSMSILYAEIEMQLTGLVSLPEDFEDRVMAFTRLAQQAAELVNENPSMGVLFVRSSSQPFHELRATLADLRSASLGLIEESEVAAKNNARRTALILIWGSVAMGAFGLALGAWTGTRGIVHPIHAISEAVQRIAGGALNTPVPESGRTDEIGSMAASVELLRLGAKEKKLVEEALGQSERRLRSIIENTTNLFYEHTADHQLTYMSPQTREFLDCDPEEAMTLWTKFATDNPLNEAAVAVTEKAIRTGERQPSYLLELKSKRGRILLVKVNEAPIVKDGKTIAVVGSLTDVTERHKAETALRRSESLFRKVFEILPVGLWIADKDGNLLSGNPAGIAIWGGSPLVPQAQYGVFKARRLPSREEILPEDWALAHTVHDGVTVADELLEIDAFDGVTRTILNYTAPVLDENGNIEGAIVVNQDVTDRVQAEEARLALIVRLREQQRLEAIGTLASGVAHEINNPLMGMINYADLIESRIDDDGLKEFAQGIIDEGRRIAEIVKNLLEFSRQGKQQFNWAKIQDIADRSIKLIGSLMRKEGISIELDMPETLPQVYCQSYQIQQVLMNLLVNAYDALLERQDGAHEQRVIRVFADPFEKEEKEWIRITIEDNGMGIAPDVIGRVFDPFFSTKPRNEGTGLGLSVSYGIVKDHGGQILVESTEGVFARFHVELPIGSEQPETDCRDESDPL